MYRFKLQLLYSLLFLGMIFSLPTSAISQSYMTKSGHVEFNSSVPLHTFTGTSDYLVGKISLQDSTVDFYVDVNTLKTGIGKRDNDMLSTLEADKYPFAEFFGKLTSEADLNSNEPQEVTVKGKFTVHGVTNDIAIDGTLQKTDEGLKVKASWTLSLEDYEIEPPGILFYRVSDKIDVSISATLPPT